MKSSWLISFVYHRVLHTTWMITGISIALQPHPFISYFVPFFDLLWPCAPVFLSIKRLGCCFLFCSQSLAHFPWISSLWVTKGHRRSKQTNSRVTDKVNRQTRSPDKWNNQSQARCAWPSSSSEGRGSTLRRLTGTERAAQSSQLQNKCHLLKCQHLISLLFPSEDPPVKTLTTDVPWTPEANQSVNSYFNIYKHTYKVLRSTSSDLMP